MICFVMIIHIVFLLSSCETAVFPAPRQARLSVVEHRPYYFYNNVNGNSGAYSYGFDVQDPVTGQGQYRTEERHPNGTVTGSYGYIDPSGRPHRYRYVADNRGYRVVQDMISVAAPKPIQLPRPFNPVQESSVTWTRPKKPGKKKQKPAYNYNSGNNVNYNHPNNIHPPSYYAPESIETTVLRDGTPSKKQNALEHSFLPDFVPTQLRFSSTNL